MSEKKQYVKEGRVCKVLKWSGRGEKPALYPRVGTKVTVAKRFGRAWFCKVPDGVDLWIPSNCLAVVPEKEKMTGRNKAMSDAEFARAHLA